MKAIKAEPKQPGSARLKDFPEPDLQSEPVPVEAISVGIFGTDVEIAQSN
jgi:hypothetical protein